MTFPCSPFYRLTVSLYTSHPMSNTSKRFSKGLSTVAFSSSFYIVLIRRNGGQPHQTLSLLITANHILDYYSVVTGYGHISVRNPLNNSTFFMTGNGVPPALVRSPADIDEFNLQDAPPPAIPPANVTRTWVRRARASDSFTRVSSNDSPASKASSIRIREPSYLLASAACHSSQLIIWPEAS